MGRAFGDNENVLPSHEEVTFSLLGKWNVRTSGTWPQVMLLYNLGIGKERIQLSLGPTQRSLGLGEVS